jgi:hypothetical protein
MARRSPCHVVAKLFENLRDPVGDIWLARVFTHTDCRAVLTSAAPRGTSRFGAEAPEMGRSWGPVASKRWRQSHDENEGANGAGRGEIVTSRCTRTCKRAGLRTPQVVTYMRSAGIGIWPSDGATVRGLDLLCGGSVACPHPFAYLCAALVERAQRSGGRASISISTRWLIASISTASSGRPSLWRRSCLRMIGRSCSRTWCASSVWLDNFGNCLCRSKDAFVTAGQPKSCACPVVAQQPGSPIISICYANRYETRKV